MKAKRYLFILPFILRRSNQGGQHECGLLEAAGRSLITYSSADRDLPQQTAWWIQMLLFDKTITDRALFPARGLDTCVCRCVGTCMYVRVCAYVYILYFWLSPWNSQDSLLIINGSTEGQGRPLVK